MSQHFNLVCEHGFTHGTCRCPAKDKATRLTKCNNPEHAKTAQVQNKTADMVIAELCDAIAEFAKAVGHVPKATTVDEYLLVAHDATEAAKANANAAQAALWPERGRGYRGC